MRPLQSAVAAHFFGGGRFLDVSIHTLVYNEGTRGNAVIKKILKAIFEFLKKKVHEILRRWATGAIILLVILLVLAAIYVWFLLSGMFN